MTNLNSLFLSQAYNDCWDDYNRSLKLRSFPRWDYVILTASNEQQAEGFRKQIEDRQNFLPRGTKFVAIPDRDGRRVCGLTKTCKVYQASTSELYGKVEEVPQKETTPFHPYSPYAVAKQYGFWMVKEYRDAYGMFAVNGILFNHESERRGENFVTRKITLAAGRIAEGLQDHLELGNMDSLRDWGYARDYVECMWLIMQQEKPEDFVIATGVQHTVRDFTEKAFAANGMTIRWEGTGIDEKGYDAATGKLLVCVNPQWFRPTDVDNLWGDPTKAKTVLGWNPQKTSYEELVEIMAKHDRELAKREKAMKAVR